MRISFCGNIGAGKTTLITKLLPVLQERLGTSYKVLSMPENFEENPYKADYYANPKEYAFRFQVEVFKHRLMQEQAMNEAEAADPNTIFLLDRSIHEDSYVFWAMLRQSDLLKHQEFFDLHDLKNNAFLGKGFELNDFLVEVYTPTAFCLDNIEKRGRPEEKSITLQYLTKVEQEIDSYVGSFGSLKRIYNGKNFYCCFPCADDRIRRLKSFDAFETLLKELTEGINTFYARLNKQ